MAAIAKFKQTQVVGILTHDGRGEDTPFHEHSNENIDPFLTYENYDLCAGAGTAYDRYKARMAEVHCMKRDDVTVLDSLVVTLPADVRPEDERKFFEGVYAFACGDYGEKNIICANVHKDEKTPHIHIDFIPVVEGKTRKGEDIEKVRHSALINKTYLDKLHPRLNAYMEKHLGYEVSILNGATGNGNKTVQELKADTLAAENREKTKENKRLTAENTGLKSDNTNLRRENDELKTENTNLKAKNEELTTDVTKLTTDKIRLEKQVSALLDVKNIPPRPPEPTPITTPYEKWADFHELSEFAEGRFDSPKKQETRRHAAYEKIVEEHDKQAQACAAWDELWGDTILDGARTVLEDKADVQRQLGQLADVQELINQRVAARTAQQDKVIADLRGELVDERAKTERLTETVKDKDKQIKAITRSDRPKQLGR